MLAQLAALPRNRASELKQLWRDFYDREPPAYGHKPFFLIKRLAYRSRSWPTAGLSARAEAKLTALSRKRIGASTASNRCAGRPPIVGTRLIRDWQGLEHCATVRDDGFEYQGRRYNSLSAIARAITGTRWNGPAFFGLRNHSAK